MNISKSDIEEFLSTATINDYDVVVDMLFDIYEVKNETEKYTIVTIVRDILENKAKMEVIYNSRKEKLINLKQLELPEQRTPEWYEMRKERLTASSLGSAIEKSHFQTREELLLSKIEDKPYESNPITEWGVKYEDVAIAFYEELQNVKILDFGMVPHPTFNAFGASPDGICEDTGNDPFVGRMVEIKCPPKRKFTKSVPHHYWMQVQGQLEVCDLDECDFLQVKLEEYENYEDYSKDVFEIDGVLQWGRTHLNYPKGATITYKIDDKLSYKYCKLNMTDEQLHLWITESEQNNIHEIKWWKIIRYENTLVVRDKGWWSSNVEKILLFYNDMMYYKNNPEKVVELKNTIANQKKRKRKEEPKKLGEFLLISDDEDN
jgi:putative phage-type endonuclease